MTDWLGVATAAFQANRLADAAMLCRAALARNPADAAAQRLVGFVCLAGGEPARALALLCPLATSLPQDEELGIALGEAAWAVEGAAAAVPHFSRVLAQAPGRVRLRVRLGLALLTAGQPGAAVRALEAAAAQDPAAALATLGMALLADGRAAEAIPVLRRAMALDTADSGCAFHLGQALREAGELDAAVDALAEAVRRARTQPHLHLALGDALFARRDYAAALAPLRQAVALDACVAVAWAKLGDAEQMAGNMTEATGCYRRAVALAPDQSELRALLGNALLGAGDAAGARQQLGRCTRAGLRRPATGRPRVGIIAAPGWANTPTDYIVDRQRLDAGILFMLDGLDVPATDVAACYDVLFNAVSDPDAAPAALAQAARMAAHCRLPVLNHPAAIAGTTRERMAERLAGIDGLHMPVTKRYARAALDAGAFAGPVLVRSAGSHGGSGVTLAGDPAAMLDAAAGLSPGDIYLTEFVDFRSADGRFRKLRIVFVDGEPFPVHLAIGDHWLSHYFRTGMAGDAALRGEEAAFLANPAAAIGRRGWDALASLPARVGLDFFGVDAAMGRDGRLVVFECNAAMLVRHADRPAAFDYKRVPAERVRDAVSRLLAKAARSRGQRALTGAADMPPAAIGRACAGSAPMRAPFGSRPSATSTAITTATTPITIASAIP